jgi:hypothetical protein
VPRLISATTIAAHGDISVSNTLAVAASVAAIIAAAYGLWSFIRRVWRATFGSRQYQQRTVNKLACGQDRDYVLAILGTPVFQENAPTTGFGQVEVLRFWMGDCWASVGFREGSVIAFSVTPMRPSFKFRTRVLALESLPLRLGSSHFCDAPEPMAEESLVAARRIFYRELYYFGNPAGYQHYLLSRNDAVRSAWSEPRSEAGWRAGPFRLPDDDQHQIPGTARNADDWRRGFRLVAKPNTLSVIGRSVSGAEEAVRVAAAVEIDADSVRLYHPDGKRALSYRERYQAWRRGRAAPRARSRGSQATRSRLCRRVQRRPGS